ncbi:MAG: helix-turn-helix domain-containing protein [Methylococcales bacterium]
MNTEPGQIAIEAKSLNPINTSQLTLSACVRMAVEQYFHQINGHPPCDLYGFVIAEVEKPLIDTVLKEAGHNQSKAASMLGISRSTLRKKIDHYGLA